MLELNEETKQKLIGRVIEDISFTEEAIVIDLAGENADQIIVFRDGRSVLDIL